MTKSRALALGDGLVIVIFSILGTLHHGKSVDLASIINNAGPILIAWFLLAPLFKTYIKPDWRNLFANWVFAVPAGLLIRYAILRHPKGVEFFTFTLVSMVSTLVLLIIWRLFAKILFYK